ncbi:alpha-1,2-fucosyltransferase [Mucilaginibacter sp. BT774]|uniref:alpha-1,2-fucosyltransferase n=1 Tax=Mucilaginibacter sp. BT774 TaxID=3062276 RepID=UPI002674ECD6|nr:alpha-1,2-fucosyltransferase [Mucilaginibacter sp. BT774]MDO3627498.1 alpha-1,2-fucosyltransferase [Mucilaginibacter sp. BT774]
MIAVKLEGRLGNQLFQYAFIYAAARRLRTSFYLDKSSDNFLLPEYFEVKNNWSVLLDKTLFSIPGFKNFFRKNLRQTFYTTLNRLLLSGEKTTISNHLRSEDVLKVLKNNCEYEGYFQSESYFKEFEREIRALYQIRKQHLKAFKDMQKHRLSSRKMVVIHIRRTDYVNLNCSLPLSYYEKAIEFINSSEVDYIFISDDPTYVEDTFKHIPNKYISMQHEIIDLQFLINADICILSNSSFSWWGAWLNANPNKVVYAPKNWLSYGQSDEYPKGISDNLKVTWISA